MAHTYVLRRVPLWPVMKIGFVLFLVIGILIGIFYALILSSWSFFASSFTDSSLGSSFGLLRNLGFILIPVIAIVYAIFGTIVIAIWVLVYNLLASVVGGIELRLEPVAAEAPAARPQTPAPGPGESAHVPPDKTITGF